MISRHLRIKFATVSACIGIGLFGATVSYAGYEKNYVGETETYTAVYEDTLVHLARKHNLGFVEVRAANPMLDPWIPGEGAEVVLPKRHLLPDAKREGLVINLPEMRVYAYVNGDEAPYTYPLGIGREGLDTPTGKTSITRKKEGPTWRPTQRMRDEDPELPASVPPGPDNPLGTHALYLGWPTYAIHGTNRPYGIGRRVSSGCIRMYPEHIKLFFEQISVGVKVNVIDQPIKVAWIGNELYLEAHPDMEQAIKMEESGAVEHQKMSNDDMALIVDKAGQYGDLLNWPRIRTVVRERKGYPVRIARYFDESDVEQVEEVKQDSESIEVVPQPKPELHNQQQDRKEASHSAVEKDVQEDEVLSEDKDV